MPTCPIHGPQAPGTNYCGECGERLTPDPPGDTINRNSPHATFHNTVVVPGPAAGAPGPAPVPPTPPKVVCVKCGHRKTEDETFDCMGSCGRKNLCLRHQDADYDVCVDCAAVLRNDAGRAQQERAALEADRTHWRQEAEQARAGLARAQAEVKRLEQERGSGMASQQSLSEAHSALWQELRQWRARAGEAEAELAAIRRTEAEAYEARQAEEARRNAEPIWRRIGIELVTIPRAGNFLYGDNKARVYLDEYSIGKTPVTNAQYKAFVDATGYPAPEHWDLGCIPPQKEKHPVVNVSWDDANAFCEWAGLRLPGEQEWEKAARGTDGRTYPWGEQAPTGNLCNFNGNVGTTTPVGQYPKGASPYGLLDMAGSVWEWCADWYELNKSRVLRGGAYYHDAGLMRCAYSGRVGPGVRLLDFGFRVASPGF